MHRVEAKSLDNAFRDSLCAFCRRGKPTSVLRRECALPLVRNVETSYPRHLRLPELDFRGAGLCADEHFAILRITPDNEANNGTLSSIDPYGARQTPHL